MAVQKLKIIDVLAIARADRFYWNFLLLSIGLGSLVNQTYAYPVTPSGRGLHY
jgi:hypothetical protein